MRLSVIITFVLLNFGAIGQETNIFHDRDFWKTNPDVETIKLKISEGNDPVTANPYAFDGVCYAILENASLESLKFLLSIEGNEVDKNTHDGRNYLMWAAYKGNIPLMEHLIAEKSDITLIDDHGYNMITFAAVGGQKEPGVYDVLINNGNSLSDTNRDGANALMLMAPHLTTEDANIIAYFTRGGLDIHAVDGEGNNIFNYAARMGNEYMMNMLIDKGVIYNKNNFVGGNAFMFAANGWRRSSNEISTFKYLDNLGIKANIQTADGNTPLHMLAFSQKDPQVYDFFVENGVDINVRNSDGNTALINATRANNEEFLDYVLPLTDDINHQNKDGYSALTYAVRRTNSELINSLLSNGANPNVIDEKGRDLVIHAFDAYNDLKKDDFLNFLSLANDHGIAPAKSFEGKTLLHLATEKNSIFLIDQAIALGFNINEKNTDGLTPLHIAAMKAGGDAILYHLIKSGADKSIKTDFEESVYDLAKENELLTEDEVNVEFLRVMK